MTRRSKFMSLEEFQTFLIGMELGHELVQIEQVVPSCYHAYKGPKGGVIKLVQVFVVWVVLE